MRTKSTAIFLSIFIFASFSPRLYKSFVPMSSSVAFISIANMETIKGVSGQLTGSMDIEKRTYSFSLPSCSFDGFVNSQQKKHYCEKFVEGHKHPEISFKGKIIEEIDLSAPGSYKVRGKGIFSLHGVDKERILDTQITVKDNGMMEINSKFQVTLEDYNIKVSKINSLAIAKTVDVTVKISLKPN